VGSVSSPGPPPFGG
jgi:hypothetical protein